MGILSPNPCKGFHPLTHFAKTAFLQEISLGFSRRMDMRLEIKFGIQPFSKGWRGIGAAPQGLRRWDMKDKDKNKKLQEAALVNGRRSLLGIYQLQEDKRDYLYAGSKELRARGLEVHRENYELVYTAPLRFTDTLDKIYERFNIDRPEDFTGHSLSVSDVIVRNQNGRVSARFVDSFGFGTLPAFVNEIRAANPLRVIEELDALRPGDTVRLSSGMELKIESEQEIDWKGWDRTLWGLDLERQPVSFHILEAESVKTSKQQEFLQAEPECSSCFYVIGNLKETSLTIHRFRDLSEAEAVYRSLPTDKTKVLGVENQHMGGIDLMRRINGVDMPVEDYRRLHGWRNPDIFTAVQALKEHFFDKTEDLRQENGGKRMELDAGKETFERAEIDGVEVLFTNARLDRDTVPEGLYCYDVRETDGSSGIAATLEPFVAVNHWGTVLSKQPFPMEDEYYQLSADSFNYLGEMAAAEEYLREEQQEQNENLEQNGGMDLSL